jgi:uncharacterized phage infection (PIP) family protein YhgE
MVWGISANEVVGSILIYLTATIASAAGVGGGILNVGIFLMIWDFAFLTCTILSLFTLFGNFIAQVSEKFPAAVCCTDPISNALCFASTTVVSGQYMDQAP